MFNLCHRYHYPNHYHHYFQHHLNFTAHTAVKNHNVMCVHRTTQKSLLLSFYRWLLRTSVPKNLDGSRPTLEFHFSVLMPPLKKGIWKESLHVWSHNKETEKEPSVTTGKAWERISKFLFMFSLVLGIVKISEGTKDKRTLFRQTGNKAFPRYYTPGSVFHSHQLLSFSTLALRAYNY